MLKSDWGIIAGIVGCSGLAGIALWDVNSLRRSAIYCERTPTGSYCGPEQFVTERSGIPITVERAISNPEPKSGKDFEKRDLAAQEASAAFAFWMIIVAAFSAVITLVGTILLYQQIRLTREAVQDTARATDAMHESNRIMRQQTHRELMRTRPVVRVIPGASLKVAPDEILSGFINQCDRDRVAIFSCTIKNTGKSSCWVKELWVKFEYDKSFNDGTIGTEFTSFRILANTALEIDEEHLVSGGIYLLPPHIRQRLFNGGGYLRGYAVYTDTYTGTLFSAFFGYRFQSIMSGAGLSTAGPTDEPLDWDDGIVKWDDYISNVRPSDRYAQPFLQLRR